MFGRILGDQSIKDIRGLSPLLSPNSSPAPLIPTSSTRESVFEKMPGQSFDLNPGCSAPLCEGINGRVAGKCVWACRIAGCSVDKNRAGSSIPHQREPEHPCNRKGQNPSRAATLPYPALTLDKNRERASSARTSSLTQRASGLNAGCSARGAGVAASVGS